MDFVNLIILNNPSNYNLKFAGIAFQKHRKNKYLLVVFPGDDELIQNQYKSIRSAKIGFAKRHNSKMREKKIKPEWSRDILRYTYHDGDIQNRRK